MALVTGQTTDIAPGSNTTQNYTVSGFGIPEAAIFIFSNNSSGSWSSDGVLGMGFWDGTNNKSAVVGIDDGDTTGANNAQWGVEGDNVVWTLYDGSSNNMRKASVTGTVTDGLTLTWTGTSVGETPYVTAIFLSGLNGVQVGHRAPTQGIDSTTQTTTTGITPKLILFAGGRANAEDVNGSPAFITFGYACYNGSTIDQGSVSWRMNDVNPTALGGYISNAYSTVSDLGSDGSPVGMNEVTAMVEDSFTTTMRISDPVVSGHAYLALDFDESVVGWDDATVTTNVDWDPFVASFTPQWAFMFPTAHDTMNQAEGSTDAVEALGLYSVNDSGDEDGHYCTMEDGATTNHFAQSRHNTTFLINTVSATPSSTILVNGNSPTFDSSGIVFADANFSQDSTARQVIGFFVQETQAGGTGGMMMKMMMENTFLR